MRELSHLSRAARGAMAFLAASLVLAAWAGTAQADPGEASDPRDVGGALDVEKASHSDDEEYVTYRVDTYDGFDNERDFYQMRWDFDLDGDTEADDACILLENAGEGDVLRGALYPGCGQEISATVNGSKPGGNTVEVRFTLRDVVHGAALTPGERFGYRVTAMDLQGNKDTVPDQGLVEQDGLPVPPKATQAPQEQPAEERSEGVPPGEGSPSDGVPAGEGGESSQAQAAASQGTPDETLLPIGVSNSPLTWVLALGLPGLAVIVVLAIRRRRLEEATVTDGSDGIYEDLAHRMELIHVPDVAREGVAGDGAWSWTGGAEPALRDRTSDPSSQDTKPTQADSQGWAIPWQAPAPPGSVHDSDT